MQSFTERVQIVLVETSHPGNIGAVARAMKNMCISQLVLVKPGKFPAEEALQRSSGAHDVLATAVVVDSLQEALKECTWVVGTSARARHLPWPVSSPEQLVPEVIAQAAKGRVAIVFGRENSGLSNAELQLCHRHVNIPCNPAFSSLNLAMAVQIVCYELFRALLADPRGFAGNPVFANAGELQIKDALRMDNVLKPGDTGWDELPASFSQLENFFDHLQQTLTTIGFYDPQQPGQLMPRLRRLFLRASPDVLEINILRGILTAMQKAAMMKKNSED